MARVVMCVPWRGGDPHREAAWAWCQARWARHVDWPIVTADADPAEPFSRAGSRNAAARAAGDWDVAAFADADCILRDPAPLIRAADLAAELGIAILPHDRYQPLTEGGSEAVYRGKADGWTMVAPSRLASAIGGLIVVPRALWEAVGGYDERFRGWGSEDGAMNEALRTLGSVERLAGTLFQMWHPPTPGWYEQYRRNKPLRRRYAAAGGDPDAMRALIAERHEEVAA